MTKFSKISEAQITRAIITDFYQKFDEIISSDVIIAGGGPSGLMAGRDLASRGLKVVIIECNNYLGGGFWLGGYLMNGATVRAPGNELLDELAIPCREVVKGLFLVSAPQACAKLIAAACDSGVHIINMTMFDDVVLRENNRVAGVVINWTPVAKLPKGLACIDPVCLESRLVIDATGHDAVVANSLARRELLQTKVCGAMNVEKSEDLVVEHTGQVYPGLIICGMSVSAVYGLPRMGPTFGGMLVSGRKAAQVAVELLSEAKVKI